MWPDPGYEYPPDPEIQLKNERGDEGDDMDENDNDDDCDDVNDSYPNRDNNHYWNKRTNNMDNIQTVGKCLARFTHLSSIVRRCENIRKQL